MALNLSRLQKAVEKDRITLKPKSLSPNLKYVEKEDPKPSTFFNASNYVYWLAFHDSEIVKIGSTSDYRTRFTTLNDYHCNNLGPVDFENTVLFKCKPYIHQEFVETQIHLTLLDNGLSTPINGEGGSEFFTFDNTEQAIEMFEYIKTLDYFTAHRFLSDLYPQGEF